MKWLGATRRPRTRCRALSHMNETHAVATGRRINAELRSKAHACENLFYMRWLTARDFLALYILAGIACHDTEDAPIREPSDADVRRCEGFVKDSLNNGREAPRRIEVQCYVAPRVNGALNCAPADDPSVLMKAADYNHSVGFVGEFVVGTEGEQALPLECERLANCCATLDAPSKTTSCLDLVDNPGREPSRCGANYRAYECSTVEPSDAEADAGADATSESLGLCCYKICGVDRNI